MMTPVAPPVDPHWIDFCIVGLLLLSGVLGMVRGLTREILSLGCWVGAVGLSRAFYPLLQGRLSPYIKNPQLLDPVAMVLVFVAAMLLLTIIMRWVSRLVHATLFKGLDRTFGFIFGLLRGSVVLWVAYAGIIFMISDRPAFVQKARLEPALAWGAVYMLQHVPLESLTHFSSEQTRKLLQQTPVLSKDTSADLFQTLMHSVPEVQDKKQDQTAPSQDADNLARTLDDFLDQKNITIHKDSSLP